MKRRVRCPICMDIGFVIYNKIIDEMSYEFVSHCTCEKGNRLHYNGRECEKNKTNYRIPSVEEFFDKNELAKENIEKLSEVYTSDEIREIFKNG